METGISLAGSTIREHGLLLFVMGLLLGGSLGLRVYATNAPQKQGQQL